MCVCVCVRACVCVCGGRRSPVALFVLPVLGSFKARREGERQKKKDKKKKSNGEIGLECCAVERGETEINK